MDKQPVRPASAAWAKSLLIVTRVIQQRDDVQFQPGMLVGDVRVQHAQ